MSKLFSLFGVRKKGTSHSRKRLGRNISFLSTIWILFSFNLQEAVMSRTRTHKEINQYVVNLILICYSKEQFLLVSTNTCHIYFSFNFLRYHERLERKAHAICNMLYHMELVFFHIGRNLSLYSYKKKSQLF